MANVVMPAGIAIVLVEEVAQRGEQLLQLGRREHGPHGADVFPILTFDAHEISLAHHRTPNGRYGASLDAYDCPNSVIKVTLAGVAKSSRIGANAVRTALA